MNITTKKCDKCPEGMEQVGGCFLPQEHEQIHTFQILRSKKLGLGRLLAQSAIVRELVNFALRYVNWETGELPALIEGGGRPSSVFPTRIFASDQDLRSVMDVYPYPCWAALPNNACIHVNPLLVQFTGSAIAEFIQDNGAGWLSKVHPGDQKRVSRISREGFQSLEPFENFYRMHKADGRWGWFEDKVYPFYRPSGHLAGYVGLMCLRGYERDPAAAHESILTL